MSDAGLSLRETLRRFTPARVGLARAGDAVACSAQLEFQLDHALARDAVHARMNVPALLRALRDTGFEALALRSAVEGGAVEGGAAERQVYLRRPDLGRKLGDESSAVLRAIPTAAPDVVFVVADGLSALAVERHAVAVLAEVRSQLGEDRWRFAPVCVVEQGRVAIGDRIGELLGARLAVVLIGERPGLSAADSLGMYITWNPRVGRTDAERVCISNIRLEGLSYAGAAARAVSAMREARLLGATGVAKPALTDGEHA